jgi:hypothetical protein
MQISSNMAVIKPLEGRVGLDPLLRMSGWAWSEQVLGPYRIYYRFRQLPRTLIPRQGWRASSDCNQTQTFLALDGLPQTRWSTGRAQDNGMRFELDLGKMKTVSGLELTLGPSWNDYPRNLRIMVSSDGKTWREMPSQWTSELYWAGSHLFKMRGDRLTYHVEPVACRYLKLQLGASDPTYYWSIYEINLYGPPG